MTAMFYDACLGSDEKQQCTGFDFRLELSVEHSAALEDQPSICKHNIPNTARSSIEIAAPIKPLGRSPMPTKDRIRESQRTSRQDLFFLKIRLDTPTINDRSETTGETKSM